MKFSSALLIFALAACALALTPDEIAQLKPSIVARSAWDNSGHDPLAVTGPNVLEAHSGDITEVLLAHSATIQADFVTNPYGQLLSFLNTAIGTGNGLSGESADIGYHYVIGMAPADGSAEAACVASNGAFPAAAIYECRDVQYSPAVVAGQNDNRLAIAFPGNYNNDELNGCQITAAQQLTAYLTATEDLTCNAGVVGSCEVVGMSGNCDSTNVSPGQNVLGRKDDIISGCQAEIDRVSAPAIYSVSPWVWGLIGLAAVGGAAGAGILYTKRANAGGAGDTKEPMV